MSQDKPSLKRRRSSIPEKKRKSILVTGGAGFIGSHLIEKLLEQGHDVICADSYFSGSKDNIARFMDNPHFETIRHDITKELLVEVEQIYHLACPASPVHYQHNSIKTLKTNVLGTLNMCGLARRTGARILLASTSEVYGDPTMHPQKEEYNGNVSCIGKRSCYDEGKRAAEALCMDYHRQHNVDVRIARIFNTYGPRMLFNDGRVISNFIVQALKGESITIYGDGSQTRSFCFVTDLVDGLIALMNTEGTTGPVNLGNPREFSISQVAQMVISKVNPALSIEYRALPKDDPTKRQPDISKAKELLKWEPHIPLEEGLQLTVQDFRERAAATPDELYCCHQKEATKLE